MKTLRSQIVASTSIDAHGDAIPREALEEMFLRMPDPWLMMDSHDPSLPPVARGYNKRFVELESGNWAICADIDVIDESKLEVYKGFSISFSRERYTVNPERAAEIVIGYNPRLFSKAEFIPICNASTSELQIDAADRHQKGIEQPIIIFLTFMAASVFSGFFKEIGKDGYQLLKKKISELAKRTNAQHGRELECHMTFTFHRNGASTEVLVSVASSDIDYLEANGLDAKYVVDRINEAIAGADARKVVLKARRSDPMVTVVYFIDRNEESHALEPKM